MKKSVLISIKPEFIAKILNGEKTIVVRKTAPKCGLPIEIYIYCTKKEDIWRIVRLGGDEFVCSKYPLNEMQWKSINEEYSAKGKIVAKFTLKSVEEIKYRFGHYDMGDWTESYILEKSCLNADELNDYLQASKDYDESKPSPVYGYAWQIEDLIIFDRPQMLCEFHTSVKKEPPEELLCPECGKPMEYYEYKYLKKAPRSWQYIDAKDE